MLIILMNDQLLPSASICQNCLMADQTGQPRWQAGELRCGRRLPSEVQRAAVQYECQMGFRIAEVE